MMYTSRFLTPDGDREFERANSERRASTTTAGAATDSASPDPRAKSIHIGTHYHLHNVPTMRLLAASCVGLVKDGKGTAAKEVEKVGKICYGDVVFEQAVKEAGGGESV